jgi:hypothetical protein
VPYEPFRQIGPEPAGTIIRTSEILSWLAVSKQTFKQIVDARLVKGHNGRYEKDSVRLAMLQGFKLEAEPQAYLGPHDPEDPNLLTVDQAVEEFSLTSRDHLYRILSTSLVHWFDCQDAVSRVSRSQLTSFHEQFIRLSKAREQGLTARELGELEKWTSGKLAVVRLDGVQRILDRRQPDNPPPEGYIPTREALALLKVKTPATLTYHGIRRHRYQRKSYWCREDVERLREEIAPRIKARRRHKANKERVATERHKERHRKIYTPRRRAANEAKTGKPTRRRMRQRRGTPAFLGRTRVRDERIRLRARLVRELGKLRPNNELDH